MIKRGALWVQPQRELLQFVSQVGAKLLGGYFGVMGLRLLSWLGIKVNGRNCVAFGDDGQEAKKPRNRSPADLSVGV